MTVYQPNIFSRWLLDIKPYEDTAHEAVAFYCTFANVVAIYGQKMGTSKNFLASLKFPFIGVL